VRLVVAQPSKTPPKKTTAKAARTGGAAAEAGADAAAAVDAPVPATAKGKATKAPAAAKASKASAAAKAKTKAPAKAAKAPAKAAKAPAKAAKGKGKGKTSEPVDLDDDDDGGKPKKPRKIKPGSALVIVESPAKAKTIGKYLGARLSREGDGRPRARPPGEEARHRRRQGLRARVRHDRREGRRRSPISRLRPGNRPPSSSPPTLIARGRRSAGTSPNRFAGRAGHRSVASSSTRSPRKRCARRWTDRATST
jgi:hypothetical protein